MLVGDVRDRSNVFDRAEEVRRLDEDAGRVCRDRLLEFLQVYAACVREQAP